MLYSLIAFQIFAGLPIGPAVKQHIDQTWRPYFIDSTHLDTVGTGKFSNWLYVNFVDGEPLGYCGSIQAHREYEKIVREIDIPSACAAVAGELQSSTLLTDEDVSAISVALVGKVDALRRDRNSDLEAILSRAIRYCDRAEARASKRPNAEEKSPILLVRLARAQLESTPEKRISLLEALRDKEPTRYPFFKISVLRALAIEQIHARETLLAMATLEAIGKLHTNRENFNKLWARDKYMALKRSLANPASPPTKPK